MTTIFAAVEAATINQGASQTADRVFQNAG